MSDATSAQRSMRAALEQCTGGPGCRCGAESSAPSSSAASSSRCGSSSRGGGHSGDSSGGNDGANHSGSEASSDRSVPDGDPVQEWSGLGIIRVEKCEHGRHAILKKCWGDKNTGRHFFGCPMKERQQCHHVQWLDEEWPERVQASLKKLWRELKLTRNLQMSAHTSLIEAYKAYDESKKEKDDLKEIAERTKRIAEQMYSTFQRKARHATVDKCKLMYLVYCLLGVIFFLLAYIFVK